MICPVCKTEIESDYTDICPVCNSEIDTYNFTDKRHYPWVRVYTTNTLLDAKMFKANLEGADIPVQLLNQNDSIRLITVGNLAIVKIYVPSNFVKDAIEIINAIENKSSD